MEHIKQSIFAFLKNPNLKVLAITGDWGVGKTHFWKNEILNNIPIEDKKEYYSYVSLFNIETINDLKIKLYYESEPMVKKDSNIAELSYIDTINKSIEAIQKLQKVKIDNYLICFDDIERKSDKLDLKTFLGYVSELKELDDGNNKILIIFNKDKINNEQEKTTLIEYKEKVFDMIINYNPTTEYNQNIIFDKDYQYSEIIKKALSKMNSKNMRILIFIRNNIDNIIKNIKEEAHQKIKENIISNIAICTWLYYQERYEIDLESISNSKFHTDLKNTHDSYCDEYTIEIIKLLITGHLDNVSFIKSIQNVLKKIQDNKNYDEYKSLRNKLGKTLERNFLVGYKDFFEDFEDFINTYHNLIRIEDIEYIMNPAKGSPLFVKTQEYIDKLISLRYKNASNSELFFYLSKANNSNLITNLEIKLKELNPPSEPKNFKSLFFELARASNEYKIQSLLVLNSYTKDAILEWIKSEKDDSLLYQIKITLDFLRHHKKNMGQHANEFYEKLQSALFDIATTDELHKWRVTEYLGFQILTIEEKADSHPPSPT